MIAVSPFGCEKFRNKTRDDPSPPSLPCGGREASLTFELSPKAESTEHAPKRRKTQYELKIDSPTLLLPKKRPDFVDEAGGGGFWIWEAVGARDWRME